MTYHMTWAASGSNEGRRGDGCCFWKLRLRNKSFRTIWWRAGSHYPQSTWARRWRGERIWATWETVILPTLSLWFMLELVPSGFPALWGNDHMGQWVNQGNNTCQALDIRVRIQKGEEVRCQSWALDTRPVCICCVHMCSAHDTCYPNYPRRILLLPLSGGSNQDTTAFQKSTRMLLFLPSSLCLSTEYRPQLLKNKLETHATSWITFLAHI